MSAQRAEARQQGEPVSIPLVTNSIVGSVRDKSTTHRKGSKMRALISYTFNEKCKFPWPEVGKGLPGQRNLSRGERANSLSACKSPCEYSKH